MFHRATTSLLGTCAIPCTTGVFNHLGLGGLGGEMGIVQGHMAKARQETKSSPVLSARIVPQPVPATLAQEATNANKMAFLLQTALGNHQRLCRVGCAMKCCSGELHGEVSQASAGLGLPPVFWPSFPSHTSSSPCLLSCCKQTSICTREIF